MNDCIFCKIINNEIPSYKIYEDDNFLAFLDLAQVTKGHTLVIPKKHVADIFEVDETLMADISVLVNQLAKKICARTGASGVNLLNNNKSVAGQTVFHYHIHIIPRYDKNDKIELKFHESGLDASKVHKLLENL